MGLPNICVDFDGVIASWEHGTFYTPGPPIEGAKEFLEELSKIGRVIIWTCRTNSDLYDGDPVDILAGKIWKWLDIWGMKSFVASVYVGDGKPICAAYIDDRAIPCVPESGSPDVGYTATVERARILCESHTKPMEVLA